MALGFSRNLVRIRSIRRYVKEDVAFRVVRSLASFLNEVAKYKLADMAGFLVFLIGELTKESCFLSGVVFAILRCKSKASKCDDSEDYLQTMRHGLKITTAKPLQVMQRNDYNT